MPPFPNIDGVEFRLVPGWPAYAASSDGRIWCCARAVRGAPVGDSWKERKLWTTRKGYMAITLYGPKQRRVEVQTVMLETFQGPRPEGQVARHLNGKSRDNNRINLAWGTQKENAADAIRHGTKICGVRQCKAKLTDILVLEMRKLHADGLRECEIVRRFPGVSQPTINLVLRRKTWKHVA